MKIAYSWLLDYVKTSLTPEQLSDRFRVASCEVEGIEEWGERFKGLITGTVKSVAKHPNADRLRIAEVTIGKKNHIIVCGAPNLEKGQSVVVALPGTTLYPLKGEPFTIQESVIRGQKSEGMLCAAEEIGLPMTSDGIIELPAATKSGLSFVEATKLNDTVLDLEITPNRPDLLSYRGLAREVATFEKRSLLEIPISSLEEKGNSLNKGLSVSIEDSKLCNRYSAICLENVSLKASPQWMQSRLLLSGIRPVNCVVDVTNYVMLELGQPLHAFDLDKVSKSKTASIKVRSAKEGEKLATLDGSERQLKSGDIVIASGTEPLAIAGIMGGQETEISPATTRILLESAHFHGPHVRKTSRRLGLRSEASTRFEKELDPEQTVTALKRAVYLLQEMEVGNVCSPLVDTYPKPRTDRPRIHLSFSRIQQVLGVHISAAEAKSILQHLGFQIPSLTKSSFEAIPPTWRKDVSLPEDIMEELIRIWGFDRLPTSLPSGPIKAPTRNRVFEGKHALRRNLAAASLRESIHLSFTSKRNLELFGIAEKDCIRLGYPLSSETEYLIPNHLIHFVENIAGVNIHQTELGLFEIGHVFRAPKQEEELLTVLLRSSKSPEHLYREMKSLTLKALRSLKLDEKNVTFTLRDSAESFYEKGSVLQIAYQGKAIGELALMSQDIMRAYKIRSANTVVCAILNLDSVFSFEPHHTSYQESPQYPSIERDLTLIVASDVSAQDIITLVEKNKGEQVLQWQINDIYVGKPLEADKKSVTLHFVYNNPDRTLEDSEATEDQKRLAAILRHDLSATIND
jgi:phenylalanyl-tRNA synthetase beta chain